MIQNFDSYTFFPGQHWSHTWERQHEIVTRFSLLLDNKVLKVVSPLGLVNHNPFSVDFIKRVLYYRKQQQIADTQNPIRHNMDMINIPHIPFHDALSALFNAKIMDKKLEITDNNFFWSTYMNPALYKIFKKSKFRIIDLAERRAGNPYLPQSIKDLERKAVSEADLVIIDNHAAIDDYRELNANIYYIPQGVNSDTFYEVDGKDRKYVGYIGNLHFAIDYPYLINLIKANPSEEFLIIGGILEDEANTVLELSNVKHVHQIPKSELNDYLAQMKLGLIPYVKNERTIGVYPTKLFEYLSAGVPVLATDLPEVSQYEDDNFLKISNDIENLSDLTFTRKGIHEAVESNTWDARWTEYLNKIEICLK